MKNLISLLSVFAAFSGFSQVYTTPEVVTNIARGEAFSILGSITNGGGGTTNIIIVTNVLPSNLITQYYNGAYLTGTFSGVFRGNGAALSNVQPASANLTNWSMLSTSVLTTAGSTKFNNSQFTTNGNTVSFRANAPVTNLFNFGTVNMSSMTVPTDLPYFLWDSDAAYALTMNFRHPDSLGDGQIVYADNTNFKWDFSNLTEPYESWINFNQAGAQFSMPPEVTAFVVTSQLGLGPGAVSDYQLASIAYVKNSTLGHKSYPSNVVDTATPLTNGILANRGGTNFWTLDGSSLTNIQVSITNLANIVTQDMTGTRLSGTFSSGGTYPLWLTNTATEGYLMGLGSDASTNIALRWDSSNNRLLAPAVAATGIFIGDGSSVTNVTTDVSLVENAVSLFSPSVKAAFKQPPVVTPNIPNPYTNALMGWFSWNNNQCPDQWYWTNMIGKMVSLGLRDAGYTAVCFDAPWQEGRDVNGYPLWNTNRFPDGIAYCSAYARSNGLKFFMWTPASQYTNNIVYANCTTNWQGAGGYAAQDAHFMATNFVEGVVLDNFWSSGFDTNLQAFVAAMETHVATNGRPVYYKTIGYGYWFPPFATNMHAMRVATDITTNWSDIAKQFNAWEDAADHVGPGGCLPDMDMLQIGNGLASPDADVAHFSIWAVSGTPLMLGMNLTNMATYVRQTITNAALIRIHQDPGQYPGRIVKRTRVPGGTQDIWLKPLGWPGSGTNVVLLVNNSTNAGYIPFRMSELGLGTNNWVRCITPFVEQDHGIVPDYFRYKHFSTAYQSRCYLIVSDPNSNNVVGTFKDYIVDGDDNVTLSGTFAGNGNSLTDLDSTNAFPSIQFYEIGDTNFIGTGGFFPFYWDRNLQIVYAAPAGNGLVANKFIAAGVGASFIGDGSGLTNISSSIPAYVVTNNQQNVSLGGTFTGNGSGLTNLNLSDFSTTNVMLHGDESGSWAWKLFTGESGVLTKYGRYTNGVFSDQGFAMDIDFGNLLDIPTLNVVINSSIRSGSPSTPLELKDNDGYIGLTIDPISQTVSAVGALHGNGAGLTNLNASTLGSGTVPEARLPVDRTADLRLTNSLTIYPSATAVNQFQVLNTNGAFVFTVNSNRVGINKTAPAFALDVTGEVNATAGFAASGASLLTFSSPEARIGSTAYTTRLRGTNVIVDAPLMLATNSPALWPPNPKTPGMPMFVTSNGYPYILTSVSPSGLPTNVWTKTNLLVNPIP